MFLPYKIFNLSKKLDSAFDDLNTSFKSVYLAYGKDDYIKKSFDPLIEFRRNLNVSIHEMNKDFLNDLYKQSGETQDIVGSIKQYVESAKLQDQKDIDAKIKELSVWQWIFGY